MKMTYKNRLIVFLLPLLLLIVVMGCEDESLAGKYAKPVITSLSTDAGFIGDQITITGTGLKDVVRVDFGSVAAEGFNASSNTDTEINVTVPQGLKEGLVQVAVYYQGNSENNLGASANSPFTVLFAPGITDISPAEAKPTKEVKISGSFLKTATGVKFGIVAVPFTEEGGILTATVPDIPAGVISLTVDTQGGSVSHDFTVLAKTPEITSFTPVEAKPNNEVTVNGIFFENVTGVKIGDKNATSFTVVSPTQLKFIIAPATPSGKITVTNNFGSGTSADNFNVIQTLALPYTVYADGLNANWQLWGWGNTTTIASTEQALSDTKSSKVAYSDDWGGFQIHPVDPNPFDISSVSKVKVSIYGGANSGGKKVGLYIKDKGGIISTSIQLTLVADAWTTFEVNLSDMGTPPSIDELVIQNQGNTGLVMYVDDLKLL